MLAAPGPVVEPPGRLLELIGAGPNAWTAAEGALKVREASYVATEGLSSEQFLHGPSVALDAQDTLVALDGGGPAAARTEAIAAAMEVTGARVVRIAERDLGEALSIFPLTVWVQRIAARAGRGARREPRPLPLRGGSRARAGHRVARLLIGGGGHSRSSTSAMCRWPRTS